LLEPKSSEDCVEPADVSSPMGVHNKPPPPQLRKLFAAESGKQDGTVSTEPVVTFPTVEDFGEDRASYSIHDELEEEAANDIPSDMDPANYQHWSLRPVDSAATHQSSLTTVATSHSGPDVVGNAKQVATDILNTAFGDGSVDVANPEGGLDATTAWGVMNKDGEREISDGAPLGEESLYTPSSSPAPSPSHAPREIYLQQGPVLVRELFDTSFSEETGMYHTEIMGEKTEAEAEPVIEVQQPLQPRLQRDYTGHLPHPNPVDPTLLTENFAMGHEKSSHDQSLQPEMLLQDPIDAATMMNNVPELRRRVR